MVNSIRGILSFKTPDRIGVETGGVEWAIDTTATSLAALPAVGETVRVFVHLHHVQDAMKLFGFASPEERRVFLALLGVSGVGPSLARKILSGTTPDRFMTALDGEDLSTLGTIPGLGKKTAGKIVLHLRGKLTASTDSASTSAVKDVVEALAAMGFDTREAGKAVAMVLDSPDISGLEGEEREKEILRRAIISLSS